MVLWGKCLFQCGWMGEGESECVFVRERERVQQERMWKKNSDESKAGKMNRKGTTWQDNES